MIKSLVVCLNICDVDMSRVVIFIFSFLKTKKILTNIHRVHVK